VGDKLPTFIDKLSVVRKLQQFSALQNLNICPMETYSKTFIKASKRNLCRLVLLLLIAFSNVQSYAQEASESNLKKNFSAIKDEQKKIAEEKEMWSYVYMVVGFSIVIGIAWFTTVAARKKAKKDAEERQKLIMKIHGDPHKKAHHLHSKKIIKIPAILFAGILFLSI
jgi:hypothetical protein